MHIVMTGATGFLGQALCRHLRAQGHDISALVRDARTARKQVGTSVMLFERWSEAPLAADAVINLAGEPLIGGRWTSTKKDRIRASRLSTTQGMVNWLARMQVRPEVVLSASAVGYYGSDYGADSERRFDESAPAGIDFGARLCRDWEAAAQGVLAHQVRLCCLRFGVVLGREGGALARMLPAFRFGLGGPLGTGTQWLSWIHLADWLASIDFCLTDRALAGAYNLCAPQPVRNQTFTSGLAKVLKPLLPINNNLHMPAWVLRLLLGEGADLLLQGQQVVPERLLSTGFKFRFPDIEHALADLCSSTKIKGQ